MSKLRFTIAFSVLCVAAIAAFIFGSAYAMATVPGTYLPQLTTDPGPITVVQVPIDFLPDSPFVATDGSGQLWLVVQGVVGSEHTKVAVVYRIQPNGTPIEMQRAPTIYAQPKFAERAGQEVVYGADRDGNVHFVPVEGWAP